MEVEDMAVQGETPRAQADGRSTILELSPNGRLRTATASCDTTASYYPQTRIVKPH